MARRSMSTVYPRLLRRVRAALIDSAIFAVIFFVWLLSLEVLENAHVVLRVAPLVLGLVALEPGLVSWSGGTIGHHLMGLRVRDAAGDQNVGFARATIRAAIRALLGWLSLAFILATRRHQAIHDYISRTVVVLENPGQLPERERFLERTMAQDGFDPSSGLRRTSVILLYSALSFVALTVFTTLILSEPCLYYDACSPSDEIMSSVLGFAWLVAFLAIVICGWRGQLFGCRPRRRIESTG